MVSNERLQTDAARAAPLSRQRSVAINIHRQQKEMHGMNQKTAKMLKKWATHTSGDYEKLKKWWVSLNWQQKTRERKKILSQLPD